MRSLRRRGVMAAAVLVCAGLAGLLTGCLGDYADGSSCEAVYQQVAPVLERAYGAAPPHESGNAFPIGVSPDEEEAHVWCVLSLDTEVVAARDGRDRVRVGDEVAAIVKDLAPGAYVTITYGLQEAAFLPENQDSFVSPGTPGAGSLDG